MSKKMHKVGEAAAPYAAMKAVKGKTAASTPVKPERTDAAFQKVADKIFKERKELLHKLAQ